jgi:hypothetical protein
VEASWSSELRREMPERRLSIAGGREGAESEGRERRRVSRAGAVSAVIWRGGRGS